VYTKTALCDAIPALSVGMDRHRLSHRDTRPKYLSQKIQLDFAKSISFVIEKLAGGYLASALPGSSSY